MTDIDPDTAAKLLLDDYRRRHATETVQTTDASVVEISGRLFMVDAKGRHVPVDLVKPTDKLEDQLVRGLMVHAGEISGQIARFKGYCFDDIAAFLDLLAEKYRVTSKGGQKGNMTFTTFDGCLKVQVAIADQIGFGPELQIAKALIDECIEEWSSDARSEIRALVDHAFEPRQEGKVNREALFSLRRVEIGDERWKRAMQAINDAIRVQGSTTYLRFYRRASPTEPWQNVTIDLASARAPKAAEVRP